MLGVKGHYKVEFCAFEGQTKIDKGHDFDNIIVTITIAEYLFGQCIFCR